MTKTIVIWFCVIFSILGTETHSKPKPKICIEFRNGDIRQYEFSKFDKKKLIIECKEYKEKHKIKIIDIYRIAFDSLYNDSACISYNDNYDHITFRNDSTTKAIVCRFDKKYVYVNPSLNEDLQKIPFDSIGQICFGPDVFNDDRIEIGHGFNMLNDEEEIEYAEFHSSKVIEENDIIRDTLVENYLSRLCSKLATVCKRPGLDYSVSLINQDAINAFTIGGGKIFLYRGLIEHIGSESELAGVMAHEIGHIAGKHVSKNLSKQLIYSGILSAAGELLQKDKNEWAKVLTDAGGIVAFFSLMKFSRYDEREADLLAFYNLYRAGIDPYGLFTFFESLASKYGSERNILSEWISTHPNSEDRSDFINDELQLIDRDDLYKDTDEFVYIRDYISALPPPIVAQAIMVDTLFIEANKYIYIPFTFPETGMKNPTLYGYIHAKGGTNNDIKLRIMDQVNFVNWSNGNKSTDLLNTDKVTLYEVNYQLPKQGTYYIVIDNSYSWFTGKTVGCVLYVKYNQR